MHKYKSKEITKIKKELSDNGFATTESNKKIEVKLMIWAQRDKELYYYATEVTTHQAKAISKQMPEKIISRINPSGQVLSRYLNGAKVKDGQS